MLLYGEGEEKRAKEEEIKKRLQGGGSPDMADALALTFAHPVRKRSPLEVMGVRPRREEYDPYARM